MSSDDPETVKVVVRCRPLFGKELVEKREAIVTANTVSGTVAVPRPDRPDDAPKNFTFDAVYDKDTLQKNFYDESAYPIVESVLQGFNGTIFAYGQTGCGKTHTMQGYADPPEMRGVIPNSFDHVFEAVRADGGKNQYLIRCSYLEIYNEDIHDLLGADVKRNLELKETPDKGVFTKDLTQVVVEDVEAISEVMTRGFENRTVGATLMNAQSSRSHSIFTIVVECNEPSDEDGKDHFRAGKLNLVDLAGSERANKTGATGARLKEGSKINLSLSALGNVISALVDGKSKHIPYRDSKLTRLLQDSLGGNTKTLMVACISPADYNYEETLSTLRYANRAKNIQNKAVINEDPKDAMLRQYKAEVDQLKALLEEHQSGSAPLPSSSAAEKAASPAVGHINPLDRSQLLLALQNLDGSMKGMGLTVDAESVTSPKKRQAAAAAAGGTVAGSGAAAVTSLAAGGESRTITVEKEVNKIVEVTRRVEVEVESEAARAEREALAQYNNALVGQRDAMGQELKGKDAAIDTEKELRATVERKLLSLQSKLMGGLKNMTPLKPSKAKEGGSEEEGELELDPAVLLARRHAEHRRTQHKLRAEKKRAAAKKAELEIAERERAEMEEAAVAAAGDAAAREAQLKKRERKLRAKLGAARAEVSDLTEEFQNEREALLNTIREQNQQLLLLKQLADLAYTPSAVGRVYEKARWDDDRGVWDLPPRIKLRSGGTAAGDDERGSDVPNLPGLGGEAAPAADKSAERERRRAKKEARRASQEAEAEAAAAAAAAQQQQQQRPPSRSAAGQGRPPSAARGRFSRPPSAALGGRRPSAPSERAAAQQHMSAVHAAHVAVEQQQQQQQGHGNGGDRQQSALAAGRRQSDCVDEILESAGIEAPSPSKYMKPASQAALLTELRERIADISPDLKHVFSTFDTNGDGVISRTEFKKALEHLGLDDLPDSVTRFLRKSIDTDDNKKITFEELQAFMTGETDGGAILGVEVEPATSPSDQII